MSAMTPAERRLLRAICERPGRTSVGKPGGGIWTLGSRRDVTARARWQTFDALEKRGYVTITVGFSMATDVEATEAGRQALQGGAR